jgi:RHS repeat-associated protein
MSRLLSETTAGRTIAYTPDDVGNVEGIAYPSGRSIESAFDKIDRPSRIGPQASPIASFGFRGPDLVASRGYGNGLSGTSSFDGARRPTATTVTTSDGTKAFAESIAWTPRSLKSAVERGDANGTGFLYRYDAAGRLTEAARAAKPATSTGNNQTVPPEALEGLPEGYGYAFDAKENLTASVETKEGIAEETPLPVDPSGRNRPAAFGLDPLAWDANGNLTGKGHLELHWDYRNRLTRVANAAGDLVTYTYDAFNRRIARTTSLGTEETVWSGWRPVETFEDGQLASRRIYGLGLDEIVREEVDFDRDGTIDAERVPLYDDTGNAVALTDANGAIVEAYSYSPFGELTVHVDSEGPEVHQLRARPGELWLELIEEIDLEVLEQAFADEDATLTNTATTETIPVTLELPVETGKLAGRRIVIRPEGDPLPADTPLALHLPASSLEDLFGNEADEAFDASFVEPTQETIVVDTAAPLLDAVVVRDGHVELRFTEEPSEATWPAITLDGEPTSWTLAEDRYTLLATEALLPGTHTLTIPTSVTDLAGTALATPNALELDVPLTNATFVAYETPDPRANPTSAADFRHTFHGLERDPATGLVYARNRWYDPQMGRFVSPDPLGYVDGPSTYAFAANTPVNVSDPLGLESLDPGTRLVLEKLQAATNQAAIDEGFTTYEEALRATPVQSSRVHRRLQEYLSPGGRFYDSRFLPETEVDPDGVIQSFGRRRIADKDARVKDVVVRVLRPDARPENIYLGHTKASDVTQFVFDLKMGVRGNSHHQRDTLSRFGVRAITLRAHGDIVQETEGLISDLRMVRRLKPIAKIAPSILGIFAAVLGAEEIAEAAESGDLDRTLETMVPLASLTNATVRAIGNELDRLGTNAATPLEAAQQRDAEMAAEAEGD